MKITLLRSLPKMFLLLLLLAVQACEKDPQPEIRAGLEGYFVVNEGGFGNSNTSLSYYDRTEDKMTNDIFEARNGRPLGDQAQSITIFDHKGYIMVQNSAKIEVINADDFSSITTITDDIGSPRYFVGVTATKGYVSDWVDGFGGLVRVIDLGQMKVVKSIETGVGPNRMIMRDGKVYVANSGGFGYANTISVIDVATDAVTSTVTVGDNPNSLQFDKDGNLWVSGIGNYLDTHPWIGKIGVDNTVALKLDLPVITYVSPILSINNEGDKLYYNYNGAVYAISTSATTLPESEFIKKDFYGLAVDPFNDELIGCEAPDFSSAGSIYVYDAAGTLKKSYNVGIAPNGIGFK